MENSRLVNKSTLSESDYINSLIFFGATDWCLPCQRLKPIIEEISKDYPDINFFYVDVDSANELAVRHKISSVPTVKIFINSEDKKSIYGLMPKSTYKKELDLYSV
jgi:thioredoxin 1